MEATCGTCCRTAGAARTNEVQRLISSRRARTVERAPVSTGQPAYAGLAYAAAITGLRKQAGIYDVRSASVARIPQSNEGTQVPFRPGQVPRSTKTVL